MVHNHMIKLATCRSRPCGISLFHRLKALIHPPAIIIDKFFSRSLRYSLLSERLSVSPLYWKQCNLHLLSHRLLSCLCFLCPSPPPPCVKGQLPSITKPGQVQSASWSFCYSPIQTQLCRSVFIKAPAVWKLLIDRNILSKGPQCVGSSDGLCSSLTFLCE